MGVRVELGGVGFGKGGGRGELFVLSAMSELGRWSMDRVKLAFSVAVAVYVS